ncbi:DUF262 domain-containing protein [Bosea caraganae]|uniref:DUF262 domain-containing protein n=2 Tax=Bosea caraganae TaxID=2763117 RepID=A0A370L0F4_9HYPH|nr:DUF262 domain-containing protein [Bosea caraganae]RDJ21639.1 DUF262 domain-containing protein [Bosea caraganae]
MSPPFQRNPVWTVRQKSSLIETILLEFPIPEIYMQNIVEEDGKEKHIIVDGQQRIRAILEYITGDFEIEEEGSRWQGLSFDDLSSEERKKIYEYRLLVRILPEMPTEQIRDIFQRINRNTVVLNAQELRHATYWGPFIKLMEHVSDLDVWNQFGIFSPNDRRRMLDTEFVSELAVAYLNGIQNKKARLEDYYRIYETEFENEGAVREAFYKILTEIDHLLPNLQSTRFRKKSDFYSLFLIMCENLYRIPFGAEQRTLVSSALEDFALSVDYSDDLVLSHARVDIYRKAVERAASDYGSRRTRHEVLREVLDTALTGKYEYSQFGGSQGKKNRSLPEIDELDPAIWDEQEATRGE